VDATQACSHDFWEGGQAHGGGGDGGGPAEMVSRDVETTLGRTPKTEII